MERQYLVTERAHFMCPNMHFGILVELKEQYNKQKVLDTLNIQANAHPFLRSTIRYEDTTNKLYYHINDTSMTEFTELSNKSELWNIIKSLSKKEWNPFLNGLLKVYSFTDTEKMTVLFMAHHLLGDGRSILNIASEFADCYTDKMIPTYVEEYLIQSLDDLPDKSDLPLISKLLIRNVNSKWKKEGRLVDYQSYSDFVIKYGELHNIEYKEHMITSNTYQDMMKSCKENDISVNDVLMAHMYNKLGTKKLIIAVDIRKHLSCYRQGALGNYATAVSIISKLETSDVYKKAKEIHQLVKKKVGNNRQLMRVLSCYLNMAPGLLDAAAISALNEFDSKAGAFVGSGMFGMAKPESYSLTNLGKIENDNIISAMFIPPASPAVKMTVGVVTVNDNMRICTSENV